MSFNVADQPAQRFFMSHEHSENSSYFFSKPSGAFEMKFYDESEYKSLFGTDYENSEDYLQNSKLQGMNFLSRFFNDSYYGLNGTLSSDAFVVADSVPLFPDVLSDAFHDTIQLYTNRGLKGFLHEQPNLFLINFHLSGFHKMFSGNFQDRATGNLSFDAINKKRYKNLVLAEDFLRSRVQSDFSHHSSVKKKVMDIVTTSFFNEEVKEILEYASKSGKIAKNLNHTGLPISETLDIIGFFVLSNEIVSHYLETGENIRIGDCYLSDSKYRDFVNNTFNKFNNMSFSEHEYTEQLAEILIRKISNRKVRNTPYLMSENISTYKPFHADALDLISMTETIHLESECEELDESKTALFHNQEIIAPLDYISQVVRTPSSTEHDDELTRSFILFKIKRTLKEMSKPDLQQVNTVVKNLHKTYDTCLSELDTFKEYDYNEEGLNREKTGGFKRGEKDQTLTLFYCFVFAYAEHETIKNNDNNILNELINIANMLTENIDNMQSIMRLIAETIIAMGDYAAPNIINYAKTISHHDILERRLPIWAVTGTLKPVKDFDEALNLFL